MHSEQLDNGNRPKLGESAVIKISSFGDSDITGKVDTGATTSSLHADNIKTDGSSVTFVCHPISENSITMDLHGSQDVLSADGGNNERPMIKLDIIVNGVELPGVVFNLNDRSEMDCPILIGQNIIKSGNFVIDLNDESHDNLPENVEQQHFQYREQNILEAVKILKENDVTIFELVEYLRTAPLYLRNGFENE